MEHSSEARPYPSRLRRGEPRRCRTCTGRILGDTRRQECIGCAVARSRGRLPTGPCEVCGLADRQVLRRFDLADGEVNLCCNDIARAGRLGLTLAELRAEAFRELRAGASCLDAGAGAQVVTTTAERAA